MGNRHVPVCDLCDKDMPIRITRFGKKEGDYAAGVLWEIGYSPKGWGFRSDFARRFSGEVCNECFEKLKKAAKAFTDILTAED